MRLFLLPVLGVIYNVLKPSHAQYLDSVRGEVHAGNFSYYSLLHPGILLLELISHLGDCDVYVSQFEKRPTFDPHKYCLQSSSCGVDTIIVPKSFKRPLNIGIYGYPSHDISSCLLNIYQVNERSEDEEEWDDLYITTKYGQYGKDELDSDLNFGDHSTIYNIFLAILNFISTIYNRFKYIIQNLLNFIVQFFLKWFENLRTQNYGIFEFFLDVLV